MRGRMSSGVQMSYEQQISILIVILATTVLSAVAAWFVRRRMLRITACFVLGLSAYLAAYALFGHRICGYSDAQSAESYCGPVYRYAWEARVFVPAAAAESFLLHTNVVIGTEDELTWKSPVRQTPATQTNSPSARQ